MGDVLPPLPLLPQVPMLMYFGYMTIVSCGFFCLTGTIGFYACYWFVRKIYGAIKIVSRGGWLGWLGASRAHRAAAFAGPAAACVIARCLAPQLGV
jgi:hypothetical protein